MTQPLLQKFNFVHTHDIRFDGEKLYFNSVAGVEISRKPSVYLWILRSRSGSVDVLYVGKAGAGIANRCEQHAGGFLRSVTGKDNAIILRGHLESAEAQGVEVWTRTSDVQELFGQNVSLFSAEEEALCALLKPQINRLRTRSYDD